MSATTPGCGSTTDARKRAAEREVPTTTERMHVTVTVDTDELREWAGRHADAGHHGVAHVLYKAARDGESLTEQVIARETADLIAENARLRDTLGLVRGELERARAELGERGVALRAAAEWLAEAGCPVQIAMPDTPAPTALWELLVDVIHADATGGWHGNELSRDEVASRLADEAGRELGERA